MAQVNEPDGMEAYGEAALWAAPAGQLPAPPIDTKTQLLPIGALHWPDAERLFLRLLHTVRPVQYAKLFGIPGQAQAGIDAYARLPVDLTDSETGGRDYITLQSRRVTTLTATKIKKAVDDLLEGEWADRTETFYLATSFDLQGTRLDTAIRKQTERLAKLGITFVPWGAQEVSTLLKDQPRIVDDFFGRSWVERFCGPEAAQALANNLPQQDARNLRAKLHDLYRAVFHAQGGTLPPENKEADLQFVILDVDTNQMQSNILDTDRSDAVAENQGPENDPIDRHTYIASRYGARRQSFRSARQLIDSTNRFTSSTADNTRADAWLADGKYRLLIGGPGAGKSSLLRFVALDLLSSTPQSIALQREHATNLPIWLPFGFLCRHLKASAENSLISAAEAWLKSQSAAHLWPLVERALQDDRLLLLVDGIDEWSDVDTADRALGMLEAFLGRTDAAAILSTRPYAVERLNWRLSWSHAQITPLTDDQRRAIASAILQPVRQAEDVLVGQPFWSAGVEPFLDQLAATPELAELSRSPLFLTLLAATWQGEPLPSQRFKIYARLVDLLIEKHPRMRQRASHADGGPLSASDATTLFAAVAYRLRVNDPSGTITKPEMRKIIVESMTDDEVLGYEKAAARTIADAVLGMAENEFGLIVSHGGGTVGFLHRVVLDHMAGQYLATRPVSDQVDAVRQFVHDPAWRDVLLALLTAQVNPHATESLLAAALNAGEHRWVEIDGYELLAEALVAGIRLTPKAQTDYMSSLVKRVETHPFLRHRAKLTSALVGTLAGHAARSHLLPIMKRWLTAPRPDPSPTMWALRDLNLNDDVAAECLFWGMRHPEDDVKINAALATAHRFGGQSHIAGQLVTLATTGPSSATQAAAILALGHGWAEAPDTSRIVDWARSQPSTQLRLVALHVLQRSNESEDAAVFRPEELAWLRSQLRHEDHIRGPWPTADLVTMAAVGDAPTADFALETLMTNGQNGGDRSLAWTLACNAFADDSRFKAWVIAELAEPERRGLILYNAAMIPEQWRNDPQFTQPLHTYVDAKLAEPGEYAAADLATALPLDDARAVLLRSLDNWRPYSAARTLADHYSEDDHVREALVDRLRGDYGRAAPMAGVALDMLGLKDGFAVLVSLLRVPNEPGPTENQVVVAQATAEAWIRIETAASQPGAGNEAAIELLAAYDPAELAALCTAVSSRGLTWHVPSVIRAWPGEPAVQKLANEVISDQTTTRVGISDIIPVAILKAYCDRSDETSRQITGNTLDTLKHIEPELREVLAFELARSSLAAKVLIETMSGWKNEPDTEVRRTAFIGLTRAIRQHQEAHGNVAGGDLPTEEMEWLRKEIRKDLCAYGPDLEERRQLAWIGMLMLGELTLADDLRETIGHAGEVPGVRLESTYVGDVDQILVDLIAENWEQLHNHFGDELFERLTGNSDRQRRTDSERRRNIMSALSTTASRYPTIAELIRREAAIDAKLRQDRRFLLWAKDENQGSEEVLRALAATLNESVDSPVGPALEALLDRDAWSVSDGQFKAILGDGIIDPQIGPIYRGERLATYVQLFPADSISTAALEDLKSWFHRDPAIRERRNWDDTLAITFGAVDSQDLAAIMTRVYTRIRFELIDIHLPMFTKPLIRRLTVDVSAVDALKAALHELNSVREDSPIFAGRWDPIVEAHPELQPLQSKYLLAVVLQHAGMLPHRDASDVSQSLASASPETVVLNPFTAYESPLSLAALDLLPGSTF